MADQLVLGDPTAPRFVYWDKKLRPTPSGKPPSHAAHGVTVLLQAPAHGVVGVAP